MSDFDDEEYLNMICVEVGTVASPIQLDPGTVWQGSQILVAF
jgi:D-hexose-6-phosphate mutarotase